MIEYISFNEFLAQKGLEKVVVVASLPEEESPILSIEKGIEVNVGNTDKINKVDFDRTKIKEKTLYIYKHPHPDPRNAFYLDGDLLMFATLHVEK